MKERIIHRYEEHRVGGNEKTVSVDSLFTFPSVGVMKK